MSLWFQILSLCLILTSSLAQAKNRPISWSDLDFKARQRVAIEQALIHMKIDFKEVQVDQEGPLHSVGHLLDDSLNAANAVLNFTGSLLKMTEKTKGYSTIEVDILFNAVVLQCRGEVLFYKKPSTKAKKIKLDRCEAFIQPNVAENIKKKLLFETDEAELRVVRNCNFIKSNANPQDPNNTDCAIVSAAINYDVIPSIDTLILTDFDVNP